MHRRRAHALLQQAPDQAAVLAPARGRVAVELAPVQLHRLQQLAAMPVAQCCAAVAQPLSAVDDFHAFQLLAALTVEQLALKVGSSVCLYRPKHWISVGFPSGRRHRGRRPCRGQALGAIELAASLAGTTPPTRQLDNWIWRPQIRQPAGGAVHILPT